VLVAVSVLAAFVVPMAAAAFPTEGIASMKANDTPNMSARIDHVTAPISVERASGHIVVRLRTSSGDIIHHVLDTRTLVAWMSMASRCINSDLPATWAELGL
jgi:hypothetical protein